jgi:hypothetical protein
LLRPNDVDVDITNHLKGRLAEAMVESIFRRAHYRVARVGVETQVQRLVKRGSHELTPDLLVWKRAGGTEREPELHQFVALEVKYRAKLADFLRDECVRMLSEAKEAWPDLYFVLVTDNPAAGRSCFQAICLREYTPGSELITRDLCEFRTLDISRQLVTRHERFTKDLFAALGSGARHAPRAARAHAFDQRLRA